MKLFRRKTEEEAVRQEIAVKEAAPFEGLTEAEAAARAAAGWDNRPVEPPTRTTGQIVRENLLTYFNLVFLVLALCLVAVKASILNLSFVIVVIINAVIGIVQELRSKKALDALNILTAPQCAVVREGREKRVDVSSLVRDDIVLFSTGEQVCADAVVVDGTCLVNEALVTGEADEIHLVYQHFDSVLHQTPTHRQLLPAAPEADAPAANNNYLFVPDAQTVLDNVLELYLNNTVYAVMLEARVGEHAARMTAMTAATDSTAELIEDLNLEFNRARQAAITTEISEIVGGSAALKKSDKSD